MVPVPVGMSRRISPLLHPSPRTLRTTTTRMSLGMVALNRVRKPNNDVLLHRSKREIEIECLEYREELEGEGKGRARR